MSVFFDLTRFLTGFFYSTVFVDSFYILMLGYFCYISQLINNSIFLRVLPWW